MELTFLAFVTVLMPWAPNAPESCRVQLLEDSDG
jgi:hypothetical protein